MEEDKYPNNLAEIQVDAFSPAREIFKDVLKAKSSALYWRHARVAYLLGAPKGRPETKTDIVIDIVIDFCYERENKSLENSSTLTSILFLTW